MAQHLHQLGHRLIAHIEFYTRKFPDKREYRFSEYGAERICNTDIQNPYKHVLQITHPLPAHIRSPYGVACERQQLVARLRKGYPVAVTGKQPGVEFVLKLLDLLRQRALGYTQLFGSLGKIQGFRYLQKIFQLA